MLAILAFFLVFGASWSRVIQSQETVVTAYCKCSKPEDIWLDIVFLLDSSSTMGISGFREANDYITTALDKMMISQDKRQATRVGFVTYSDNATLYAPLTAYHSTDDLMNNFLPDFEGRNGSDFKSAFLIANDQFSRLGRSNVRKVIVVVASHYQPNPYTDPTALADQFKKDGGVIVTIEFGWPYPPNGSVPILQQLATPCMQLSNRGQTISSYHLNEIFCNANCFCPKGWNGYSTNATCEYPDGGCYLASPTADTEPEAQVYCSSIGATLPKLEDSSQSAFVAGQVNNGKTKQWLGLKYDGSQYRWLVDNSPLSIYQPWDVKDTSKQCVYMQKTTGFYVNWYSEGCDTYNMFTCQSMPCSGSKYCDK